MYSRILVPVDGSETSSRGLVEAIALASDQKATLHLVHVINDFPMLVELSSTASFESAVARTRAFGDQVLAEAGELAAAAQVRAERVLREVVEGRAADVIVREAQDAACDLIVMGTHGRRGLSRLAMGSDADLVVRQSPVPVLMVRQTAPERSKQ